MSKIEMNYKQAYTELHAIQEQLESSETDIDQLALLVQRANELVLFCQEKLRETEQNMEAK